MYEAIRMLQYVVSPLQNHLKLKSLEIPFLHYIRHTSPIVSQICTEDDNVIAILYTKFHNNRMTTNYFMDNWDFSIFELETGCGGRGIRHSYSPRP